MGEQGGGVLVWGGEVVLVEREAEGVYEGRGGGACALERRLMRGAKE